MKDFLFDAWMLFVGCVLVCIACAFSLLALLGSAVAIALVIKTGNVNMLWWLCLSPIVLAMAVGMWQFVDFFWGMYL